MQSMFFFFFTYSGNLMLILIMCPDREKIQKEKCYQRSLGNSTRLKESDAPIVSFQVQAERSQDDIAFTVSIPTIIVLN